MIEFDKRQILYGELFTGEKKLGNTRCEVILNEIDTSSMKVKFSVFEGPLHELMGNHYNEDGLKFISKSEENIIEINAQFVGFHLDSAHDEILQGKVQEFKNTGKPCAKQINEIQLVYKIMPNSLLKNITGTVSKHWQKGLLYGWEGWRREYPELSTNNESEWNIVEFHVPSRYGTAIVQNNIQFHEDERNGRKYTLVTDIPILRFKIVGVNLDVDDFLDKIDNEMDVILWLLSFIEGDFVDWCYTSATCFEEDKNKSQSIERYRSARKIESRRIDEVYILRHKAELMATFTQMVSAFHSLPKEEYDVCKNSIERYVIACRKNTIDTRLIYMHSCLDVLIKYYDKASDPFSKKLLHVLKTQNIEWNDLYPEMTEEEIKNKKQDFPINTLRNKMLHEGEYSEDFQLVISETDRARGLAERIILNMLKINHVSSGLGRKDRFH